MPAPHPAVPARLPGLQLRSARAAGVPSAFQSPLVLVVLALELVVLLGLVLSMLLGEVLFKLLPVAGALAGPPAAPPVPCA
jgi:hypothetical protein